MNNKVVYNLHYTFFNLGFSCLRFNFRGIGKSQGQFDQGVGELSDAASALDYLQLHVPNARSCWVAGFSFGAWIAMQLLMRRPEVKGFVAVSPPAKTYDFNFLAPCPSSGMLINGKNDKVVNVRHMDEVILPEIGPDLTLFFNMFIVFYFPLLSMIFLILDSYRAYSYTSVSMSNIPYV